MKYLKLIIVAACCVLALFAIRKIRSMIHNNDKDVAAIETRYDELKKEIDLRCCSADLNVDNFDSMVYKIKKSVEAGTIKSFQAQDLYKYLYTESCDSLLEQSLRMFSTETYKPSSYDRLSTLLARLQETDQHEKTSSLKNASVLYREYGVLVRMLNYRTDAAFYGNQSDDNRFESFEDFNDPANCHTRSLQIKSLQYYDDCFCQNDYVEKGLKSLEKKRAAAYGQYYFNLVKKIEKYYQEHHRPEDKHKFNNDVSRLYLMNESVSRELKSYSYLFD